MQRLPLEGALVHDIRAPDGGPEHGNPAVTEKLLRLVDHLHIPPHGDQNPRQRQPRIDFLHGGDLPQQLRHAVYAEGVQLDGHNHLVRRRQRRTGREAERRRHVDNSEVVGVVRRDAHQQLPQTPHRSAVRQARRGVQLRQPHVGRQDVQAGVSRVLDVFRPAGLRLPQQHLPQGGGVLVRPVEFAGVALVVRVDEQHTLPVEQGENGRQVDRCHAFADSTLQIHDADGFHFLSSLSNGVGPPA